MLVTGEEPDSRIRIPQGHIPEPSTAEAEATSGVLPSGQEEDPPSPLSRASSFSGGAEQSGAQLRTGREIGRHGVSNQILAGWNLPALIYAVGLCLSSGVCVLLGETTGSLEHG